MVTRFSIAELARAFEVTPRTIRYYESEGLIAPLREGRRRIYRPRDRVRLQLILRGKRLGFSLGEIAEILELYDAAPGETGQLEVLLGRIAARRADLERRREDIEAAMAQLDQVAAGCRTRLAALSDAAAPRRGARSAGGGA